MITRIIWDDIAFDISVTPLYRKCVSVKEAWIFSHRFTRKFASEAFPSFIQILPNKNDQAGAKGDRSE
jgi:hypothetical protein